jgi:hypothetical protein
VDLLEAEVALGFWRDSELSGFFLIGGRLQSQPYCPALCDFCAGVAAEVSRMLDVIENAEKLVQAREAAARRTTEHDLALLMRRRMPPPETTEVHGVEYGVASRLSDGNGAEFCDVIVLPGGALGLVMAEADSGGLEAAIQLVRMQALLRSRFYVYGDDLREMLESVERALAAGDTAAHPARLLLGRYEARGRRFVYINAGYHPPILLKNRGDGSEMRRLSGTGRLLSAGGPVDWNVEEVALRRRDLLLCVSPGLAAQSADATQGVESENEFMERLFQMESQPARMIASRMLEESLQRLAGEAPKRELSVIALRPNERVARAQPLALPPVAEEPDHT